MWPLETGAGSAAAGAAGAEAAEPWLVELEGVPTRLGDAEHLVGPDAIPDLLVEILPLGRVEPSDESIHHNLSLP